MLGVSSLVLTILFSICAQVQAADLPLDVFDSVENTPNQQLSDLLELIGGATSMQNNIDSVHACLERGAAGTCRNGYGQTMLHLLALYNGPIATGQKLFSCGCSINVKDLADETPLHCAAKVGNLHWLQFLLSRGAAVNEKMQGGLTPLHLAAWNDKSACVAELLKHGADPVARNDENKSCYDLACELGFTNSAQILKLHMMENS